MPRPICSAARQRRFPTPPTRSLLARSNRSASSRRSRRLCIRTPPTVSPLQPLSAPRLTNLQHEDLSMYAIAEPPARFSASFVESLPTAADLTARMQQTLPDIKRRARETERLGRVPDENLALLRNAGLYRVAQ